jgi:hypothetical protein
VAVRAAVGLAEDAEAAEAWLRRMVETAHLPWPSWLDDDGQPVPEAEEQPLEGWRRSQPVRYGRSSNVALGLVGAVVAAVSASKSGWRAPGLFTEADYFSPGEHTSDPGPLSAAFDHLAEAVDWEADHWQQSDVGRWEIPEPRRQYSAGRLSAWTALDRMARLARAANPLDLRAVAWQQEGAEVRRWLEGTAKEAGGWLPIAPGSAEPDSALLAVAWTGPWPVNHPVVEATVDRVVEQLTSSSLLYRYSDRVADEQAGPDHPDLEASLMAVRALARLGRWEEAHERMEAVTSFAGSATPGLLAETADPLSGQMFGNFPGTRAHLALVEAALALAPGPR